MENFIAKLIKQRFLICLVFILLIAGGIYSFKELPIDAFPDLANNQVVILTDAPGMAPVETEQLITIPIESVMNGLPGVEEVRSISKFGLSAITIVFHDNVNVYLARQLVNERLQGAKERLPKGINSELGPITTAMGEIYQYVVEGKGYSPSELKTIHDWDIKTQLRTVAGVNEVNSWGGLTKVYQVTLFPEQLQKYGISLKEVFEALEKNNDNFSGGIIEHEAEQYIVRGLGRIDQLQNINNIIIKAHNGSPIFIRNVAKVEYGSELRQGAVTKDGNGEVVTGIVMMLKGENSQAVIQRIKEKIKEVQKSLPEGIFLKPFYDQTNLVEQTIETVKNNLMEGGTLVIVVLLLMLGNIRAALIVASVIPISMMFSFMGMKALGITANIMSLGAIDFGMIVDGSIVVVENSLQKLSHEGKKGNTFEIIQDSLREMAKPILFGTLIIAVVYIPILSLEGMEYKLFSPMVFTVCFALLGSVLTSLTLVPVMCSLLLRGKITEKESIIVRIIRKPYLLLLEKAMKYRKITVSLAVLFFASTLMLIPLLGTEFVPELDENDYIIETRNLPSISLSEATNVSTRIEKAIKDIPEIKTVVSKTGRPDLATDPMGVYQTDVYAMLYPKSQWRKGLTKDELTAEISKRLDEKVPGANFNFTQPIAMRVDELVSGVRSDVAAKIFGDDFDTLQKIAHQVENVLKTVKGNSDLQVEKMEGSLQVVIKPDYNNMAKYGVNISDIREVVETAIMGKDISEIIEGKRRFALKVRFPEGSSTDPRQVENLVIQTSSGNLIKLYQVAKVTMEQDLEIVNREFAQRLTIVQCNVRNRDIGSFVKEAQKKIDKELVIPPGYYIKWGGQFENQQRAMLKLALVVPLSILVIFLLLMATFSSLKHSLIVMLNVPFALTGGIIALWVRGIYLSVPAAIGFIALFGVAVLNGIVLISTINRFVAEGKDINTAIRKGAESRLRPVLMTAMVATLGFLPMAISNGSGAEIQKPLATVVIGGLLTSTFLTLLVIPVIYYIFSSGKKNEMSYRDPELDLSKV